MSSLNESHLKLHVRRTVPLMHMNMKHERRNWLDQLSVLSTMF